VVTLPVESITEQKLTSLMQKANQNLEKGRTHLAYLFSNKEFFCISFEGFKYVSNTFFGGVIRFFVLSEVSPQGAALPGRDSNPVSTLRQADSFN
jgi:hypothetical protein